MIFIEVIIVLNFLNFYSCNDNVGDENSIESLGAINQRVKSREFPSVFQAWGNATNLASETLNETRARHDLAWWGISDVDGLVWDTDLVGGFRVLATGFTDASIEKGMAFRRELLSNNPNMILLANLNYRGAKSAWLPESHEWWLRDTDGNKIVSWTGGGEPWYMLDFANPDLRSQVAGWARAAIKSGVYDGVLLDWWDEDQKSDARMALLKAVRSAIGDTCLIVINANDRYSIKSAPYINGVFMETAANTPTTSARWEEIKNVLMWNQINVLEPKLVCLEVWYENSREELNRMRAATTLSMILSDGYCLFSEPNSVPGVDHKHDWYPFWDKTLGKAIEKGTLQSNGTYIRKFENGYAVYNPMGNGPVTTEFQVDLFRVSTGESAKSHILQDQDGEIFLNSQTLKHP